MVFAPRIGWKREPEPVSAGHYAYAGPPLASAVESDLRSFSSPRHNQLSAGSCVAQAVVKGLEIERIRTLGRASHVDLSVSTLYYLARELETPPATDKDGGTYIYLAMEVLRRFGVCCESDWPYDPSKIFLAPPWRAMRRAHQHKIEAWMRIHQRGAGRVSAVQSALAAGHPVVYGTIVGDNWERYQEGDVLRPTTPEEAKGGHATVLVGWLPNLHGGVFVGENSWAEGWGDDGFYLLDPAVVSGSDSGDFTVIQGGWE